MTGVLGMLKVYKKDFGDTIGSVGGTLLHVDRVPTGFFEFDLATGGGFPKGAVSLIYGNESCNKTNITLKAIAQHQMLWPDQMCVFVDIEHAFNPEWAAMLGVDTERLVVLQPDYAEQAGDMIDGLLAGDDCGLLVVDSVAALMTNKMAEKSLEDVIMGGPSVLMNRLCDKITQRLREAQKQGRPSPTVILINQLRTKIGMVFGNPMTMPGGVKQKFLSSLTVRVTAKNVIDAKISKVMPVAKETQFTLEKWKVPVTAVNGMFTMITHPHKDMAVGDCDSWSTVAGQLQALGLLVKEGTSWKMYNTVYPTKGACRDKYNLDKAFGYGVRKALIERALSEGALTSDTADVE